MSFINEITDFLGLEDSLPIARATIFFGKAVYFENVKSIKSYSEGEIVLQIKKGGILTVKGDNLEIKSYVDGDVSILGKVLSVQKDV